MAEGRASGPDRGLVSAQAPESLRVRRRRRVRRDIYDAAVDLFAERGYSAVTTDDIAAAAGVSISTYFRHAGAKDELLLDPLLASGEAIIGYLRARPADEPAVAALVSAVRQRTGEIDGASMRLWRAAIATAPELIARVSLISAADRAVLADIVAGRLGADAETDERPGLVVHLVLAAAEYAFRRWLSDELDASLVGHMNISLDYLVGGFGAGGALVDRR